MLSALAALVVVAVVVWHRFPPSLTRHDAAPAIPARAAAEQPVPAASGPPPGAADRAVPGLSRTYQLDYRHVPQRRAVRADFAVSTSVSTPPSVSPPRVTGWLLVHDPSLNRFARYRVPNGSDGRPIDFQGLAGHGEQALFAASIGDGPKDRLCLLTLSTGRTRWFDADPQTYAAGVLASASPDGTQIATIAVVYDPTDPRGESEDLSRVAVGVIDVASGMYRRLWLSPENAGWGGNSGVAWSPDQRSVAATYVSDGDQTVESIFATLVLGVDGRVKRVLPLDTVIVPNANSAWLRPAELITASASAGVVVNTSTGARHAIDIDEVLARTGNWFVLREATDGNVTHLVLRPLAGGETHPWLTFTSGVNIEYVGFA